MAGCNMHGTMAPSAANTQWQGSRTVGQLKQDMRQHHDQAMAGGDGNPYVASCFGKPLQLTPLRGKMQKTEKFRTIATTYDWLSVARWIVE